MEINYRHLKRISSGKALFTDAIKRELLPSRFKLVKHMDKVEKFLPAMIDVIFVDKLKKYDVDIVWRQSIIRAEQKHATVTIYKQEKYTGKCIAVRYDFWELMRAIIVTDFDYDESQFGSVFINDLYLEIPKYLNYKAKQLNVRYNAKKFEFTRKAISEVQFSGGTVYIPDRRERTNQLIEMVKYYLELEKRITNKTLKNHDKERNHPSNSNARSKARSTSEHKEPVGIHLQPDGATKQRRN